MSTFGFRTLRCAVCGEETTLGVCKSTNAFGSPDLDLRPPPMQRDTMGFWVQKCPHCGYAARNISKYEETDRAYLASEEYRGCEGLPIRSAGCARFYQYHLLGKKRLNRREELDGLLCAIWTCDDEGEEALAATLRLKAAAVLEAGIDGNGQDAKAREQELLQRADLLRRAGAFQKLLDEYRDLSLEEELLARLLKFELGCAEAGDTRRYTVQQALHILDDLDEP